MPTDRSWRTVYLNSALGFVAGAGVAAAVLTAPPRATSATPSVAAPVKASAVFDNAALVVLTVGLAGAAVGTSVSPYPQLGPDGDE